MFAQYEVNLHNPSPSYALFSPNYADLQPSFCMALNDCSTVMSMVSRQSIPMQAVHLSLPEDDILKKIRCTRSSNIFQLIRFVLILYFKMVAARRASQFR